MLKRIFFLTFVILFSHHLFSQPYQKPPKLIVKVVVDQMRQDYLYRYWDLYSEDGFKKLVRYGYNFANTHYSYYPTFTAAGHACIGTGAVPAVHGVVANSWIERTSGERMYCSRDWGVKGVGTDSDAGRMSPKNMKTTTFGDELKLATNFRSKVYGISMKDRGAIMASGHYANAAYWFHEKESNFISSTYYMNELPIWVENFNAQNRVDYYLNKTWSPSISIQALEKYSEIDNSKHEGVFKGKDHPVFPYHLKNLREKNGDRIVLTTPYGNSIAFEFAKELIQHENLGRNESGVTDLLTLSLSSTDYIGHFFGIRSVEIADTYLRLDKELGAFISMLEDKIGEDEFVIVLSSDHGGADNSGYLTSKGYEVGRFDNQIVRKDLRDYLKNKYETDLIEHFANLQIYLNEKNMAKHQIDRVEVIEEIKSYLKFKEGVFKVFSADLLSNGQVTDPILHNYMQGYHEHRSGDVFVVLEPGWLDMGWQETGTTHGSVFSYDTHIPMLFYGKNIPHGHSYTRTNPNQIASTLSAMMGIAMPSGCVSEPLTPFFK